MARIEWGLPKDRLYEHGVDRGLLYVEGHPVVPWNGLLNVTETSENEGPQTTYLDGVKIVNYNRRGSFAATIEALYSPEEFDECDGTLQEHDSLYSTNNPTKPFDISYRTRIGSNDYRLHLVYNALATPSSRSHNTISDKSEPDPITWDITTSPNQRSGGVKTHFILDTTKSRYGVVKSVEEVLYGTATRSPRFPSLSEIKDIIAAVPDVTVIDLGNGRWRITGPDSVSRVVNSAEGLVEFNWAGIDLLDGDKFNIRE